MDKLEGLRSEIDAKGPHPDGMDDCPNCMMAMAIRDNPRFQVILNNMMSHLMDQSPFVGLSILPVTQYVFDAFCLGVLSSRSATISAVERREIEVWINQKMENQDQGQSHTSV